MHLRSSLLVSAFGCSLLPLTCLPTLRAAEPVPAGDAGLAMYIRTNADILHRARVVNEDLYSSLKSFVCRENIQRYKGSLKTNSTKLIDTVSASLSFENGQERYGEIRQNNRERSSISSLTGAWSEGEYGTLLLQTQRLMAKGDAVFQSFEDYHGIPAAIYRIEVAEAYSPWDFVVAGKHYNLPFRSDAWVSSKTGEILKIVRTSLTIPEETHISAVEWDVTMSPVNLNGQAYLLPDASTYEVRYAESNHREWNVMTFTGYHRYGAESSLTFN